MSACLPEPGQQAACRAPVRACGSAPRADDRAPRRATRRHAGLLLAALWSLGGCAASVSEIEGLYARAARPAAAAARPVRVQFTLAHLTQRHGFDAIPKYNPPLVGDFDEVFREATSEIPNLESYALEVESAPRSGSEVVLRPDYRTDRDYSVRMVFLSESSFAADVLAGLVALGTLTIVPAPFRITYTATADVRSPDGRLLARYTRAARVTQWVEGLLLLAYPFRPPEGEQEKLVSRLLHDLFREMAAEGVLGGAERPAA